MRIDASVPLDISEIFVDAHSGKIINRIPLIAHADVQGTAQTLYNGNQTITADSYNGSFRLRENGRKIETFDATNATSLEPSGFIGVNDFYDSDNNWSGLGALNQLTISSISSTWWRTIFVDESPDLYIVIRDGSGNIAYSSNYSNNDFPPVTFNPNIYLANPPYTVELWDYDAVGGSDFGGTYSLNLTSGTNSFSGNGNVGSYVIQSIGHPAHDVHWGMEKTYDFYSNIYGRNSYDGNGSTIKNYLNSPFTQANQGGDPNNAYALPSPYNVMVYGMGDGTTNNPLVGLDVEGHEFTHMVINYNGNGGLTYEGESGALNESFADIFGTCIEFYSGISPNWFMGEDFVLQSPFYARSMSNPNSRNQPDTYASPLQNGFWENPNCGIPSQQNDNCGVHYNSGVQNFWFYLLCQGGSGINDINNAYNVSGIGINQAQLIAYRNLVTYLSPNSTYWDSYNGSLQAAADLYGVGSTQWNAVNNAWYAVGIGNGTNSNTTYCSGTTFLYDVSGTFTDGSGNLNYLDDGDCIWSIQPAGANTVTVTFPQFNTEAEYDSVMVYDGPDENYPLLMTWWGTTLPPAITSTDGALTVRFISDESIQAPGWTANYTSSGVAYCDGGNLLTTPTGSFNDGSGGNNYGNNQWCYWYIAPPCANSITLSFSQFATEDGYDGIIVYDGGDLNDPQLLNTSGTNIPGSVTSSGGEMLVLFQSDFSFRMQGFSASYTSTGSAYCSGVTNLTNDWGELGDGSGTNDYCNNMNCNWLIQPLGATTVTLNFDAFDLEPASIDGQSIFDAVEVYDGSNTNATLLGRFTGANLPPSVTSSGANMYVKFYSDEAITASGWSAYYTSTTVNYCTGLSTLTASSGTFADGSSSSLYGNNADCQWLIQPPGVSSISLGFTAFDTETNYDGVIVYDGDNTSSPILSQFSGNSVPPVTTSTGGSMLVQFLSDVAVRQNGWDAYYNSGITVGVEDIDEDSFTIFPNPSSGTFTIQTSFIKPQDVIIRIYNALGETVEVIEKGELTNSRIEVELESASGLYFVEMKTEFGSAIKKISVN
ncbi:MAG: M4 family metallopeptidase [Flavobacteriales bacterium]|nr:M4 family metallopeptidase [Flavobacteriales bacterium]